MKTKRYVKAWLKSFGEISSDHLHFSMALIQKLVADGAVSLSSMEELTQIKMRRLKNFVKKRPKTEFNEDHLIVGHGPISLNQNSETLELSDRTVYAPTPWHALQSVFFMDLPAVWRSQCHLSEKEIEVKVLPEGIETECDGVYISFLHPDELSADHLDTMQEWCVCLYKDEMADKYLADHPSRVAIPLSQAYQFARDVYDSWHVEDA